MILERIHRYIQYRNLSFNKFEISLGVSHGSVSNAWKNKKNIGSKVVTKILETYPDLSAEWLLRGEGEMIRKASEADVTTSNKTESELDQELISNTLQFLKLENKEKLAEFLNQASAKGSSTLEQFVLATWEEKYGHELKNIRYQLMTLFTDKLDREKEATAHNSKSNSA